MATHNEIKRDKRIVVMVTEEERDWIKAIAARTAYKSLSNFCREMIFQVCEQVEHRELTENTVIGMEITEE